MKINDAKLIIQDLVEKNHKINLEHKNIEQLTNNKKLFINSLLDVVMNKDVQLKQIHLDYNKIIVTKDSTIQNFSEKHNEQIISINNK